VEEKNTDFNLSPQTPFLLEWAWGLYKQGNVVDMIDPAVIESCGPDREQALRCVHVGLLCTQAKASPRPSMSTVNLMLSTNFIMLPEPTEPAFLSCASSNTESSSHTSATISSSAQSHTPGRAPPSNADASISELEAR